MPQELECFKSNKEVTRKTVRKLISGSHLSTSLAGQSQRFIILLCTGIFRLIHMKVSLNQKKWNTGYFLTNGHALQGKEPYLIFLFFQQLATDPTIVLIVSIKKELCK